METEIFRPEHCWTPLAINKTSRGLGPIAKIAVEVLNEKLKSINIPDIKGDAGTPLGHISYSLSSIKISGLSIPSYALKTKATVGLELSVSGVSISMNGQWHYREDHWPHISDSGSFSIDTSGISFDVQIKIVADSKGHPNIAAAGCSANIGSMKIHFSGGASWLYNLFDSKIASAVRSALDSELCKAATSAINDQGAKAVAKFPVKKQIDKYSLINYALVENPDATHSYLDIFVKGEFQSVTHPSEAPFSPEPFPSNNSSGSMMYAWISDYVFNTASLVYMNAGVMNRTITASDVPKTFSFPLNTKTFKLLVPLLYKKYPDRPMQLKVYPTKVPTLNSKQTGVALSIIGNIEVYVVLENGTAVFAFTLSLTISGTVKVAINGTNITAHSTFVKLQASLVRSAIGDISANIKLLQVFLDLFVDKMIIKELNERGDKGFPLPVIDGVTLVNPKVTSGEVRVLSYDLIMKAIRGDQAF
ncbi:hypothetical protein QZH41_009762 [Actinostola sp. cb2023]|nr:hypothetical protein QZH41_009762 [Actinostola sp. cb2023]